MVIVVEKIKEEALNSFYRELAQVVGLENMEKLYDYYKGQQLSFPIRIYDKEYVLQVLKEEYDGTNAKALSRKLGYSERWIKQLAKNLEKRDL